MTLEQSITYTDSDEAFAVLGTWFIERMMDEHWSFGLRMTDGSVIAIRCIISVTVACNGSIWLNVDLREKGESDSHWVTAPTSRTHATINAAHVVMAYELADT